MENKLKQIKADINEISKQYAKDLKILNKEYEEELFKDKEILYVANHFVTTDKTKLIIYCMDNNISIAYKTFLGNKEIYKIKFDYD
jgi:uncharacterized protein YdgA (DUF945 family)